MKYKLKEITTVTPEPTVELPDGAIILEVAWERYLYPTHEFGFTTPKPGDARSRVIKSWTISYLEPLKEE